jgi:hypothetical protein
MCLSNVYVYIYIYIYIHIYIHRSSCQHFPCAYQMYMYIYIYIYIGLAADTSHVLIKAIPITSKLTCTPLLGAPKSKHGVHMGPGEVQVLVIYFLLLVLFCTYAFLAGLYGNIWCRFFNILRL